MSALMPVTLTPTAASWPDCLTERLGVAHTGTAGLLFEAFLYRFLSYQELVELLEKLGKVAWISPELLAGILRRAREVESK